MKTAVITGVLGQDGSYLTEHLMNLGYKVVGITRRHSSDTDSYGHLKAFRNHRDFVLLHGDIADPIFLTEVITKYKPDEWYNLAAQSHVGHSFQCPLDTFNTDASSVVAQLSLLQKHSPSTRFYQASTSEMFGGLDCPLTGFDEESPFHPRSPYGVAKVAAHWATINFREAYGMYACAGILFNHESPRRGLDFVTRKVTHKVARIKLGDPNKIVMGNIDAYRDWGHAKDYVQAMHMMLQDKPDEYVISTGQVFQVRDLLELTFEVAGLGNWEDYVEFDPKFMRPSEVPYLKGDSSKARKQLGWKPSYNFGTLIEEMYKSDIDLLTNC